VSARLLSLIKGNYQLCYSASGTDASTNAINLAKLVTGRKFVVTFNQQYHGKYGVLSGRGSTMRMQSMHDTNIIVMPSILDEDTGIRIISDLESLLKGSVYTGNVAAVILELAPIANGGGRFLSSKVINYLKTVLAQYNILLIIDEVQTGFWRTGKAFCFQHYQGLVPDLVPFGKSIAGGLPFYGTYVSSKLVDAKIEKGFYSSTFAFNLTAASVVNQILDLTSNLDFIHDIERKGELFDLAISNVYPEGVYQRKGLLISLPVSKTIHAFAQNKLFVRIINDRLLLTPPLFTSVETTKKAAEKLKEVIG
jgi:4-aminobutyrate aminotransferase-like enzyme